MPDSSAPSSNGRAVFLSYAREDTPAAKRICDALRGFGVEVWFDQSELRGGDSWDAKIKQQIRTCSLFVPIISATTQGRGEGYFRREWRLAVDRSHDMAAGFAFLLPIVIDATAESAALVPEEFMKVQWTRLQEGAPTPEFVAHVRALLDNPLARPGAAARTGVRPTPAAGTPAGAAPARKTSIPGWAWGAAAAAVVGFGAVVLVQRRPSAAGPADHPAAAIAAESAAVNDKSLAVLPFTNMSSDKDTTFFADGIHEDVLTNLALVHELRVVSRTSVMRYRDTVEPIPQIGKELGVAYVLEGSVQRQGNRVRVTGQLIKAASDEHVWAQAYDRDLTDIFGIQSELATQIAAALQAQISPREQAMISDRPTENAAAYDLYLRARDINNRESPSPESTRHREVLLQHAVALDSKFASAWGELADAYAFEYFSYVDTTAGKLAQAKQAIDQAVALAPDRPDVIQSLGTYYYYGYRDYAKAAEQYQRLVRLQPNSPSVAFSLGLIARRQGHWRESYEQLKRATELDPGNSNFMRQFAELCASVNFLDEAEQVQRRVVAQNPDSLFDAYMLAVGPYYLREDRSSVDAFIAGLSNQQRTSAEGVEVQREWAFLRGDCAEAVRLDGLQTAPASLSISPWEQPIETAVSVLALGDRAAAIRRLGDAPERLRKELGTQPDNAMEWARYGVMLMVEGNYPEALAAADRAVELMPISRDALDGPVVGTLVAVIEVGAGKKDRAIERLVKLAHLPFGPSLPQLRHDPGFAPLHGDSRYEALLKDPTLLQPMI